MLRHPSLRPLSRQHHQALALCVFIRRELQRAQPVFRDIRRRVWRDFNTAIRPHFDLEERVLFPAVTGELGPLPLIGRLREEHRRLERMARALAEPPDRAALEEFSTLLRDHVRLEENDLFESIQARFSTDALVRLGEALDGPAGAACGLKGDD